MRYQLIDTHAHINFEGYDEDREVVIERIRKEAMRVLMPSSQLPTSQQAVLLAEQYDFLYAAIGIHPIHVFEDFYDQTVYQKLIDSGRVTAVGEVGMDYYHIKDKSKTFEELKSAQEKLFRNFISLARANSLPLVVHGRFSDEHPDAYKDILRILSDTKVVDAVIHCYTGDPDDAEAFIKAGYYLGFTGIITFDKTGNLASVVRQTPLDKILMETDAPYLSPEPYRGKRNEPVYVIEVARKIAEIKGLTLDQVIEQTTKSAEKLFKLT